MKFIFAVVILVILVSCSLQKNRFKVDNSISSEIDSFYVKRGIEGSDSHRGLYFQISRTFDYKVFPHSNTDLTYFLGLDSSSSTEKYLGAGSECHLDDDTINLIAILNYENTIGLKASIFDNKVEVQLRLLATDKKYAISNDFDNLQNEIILNSEYVLLILTERPSFMVGGRLKGSMVVKFEPFYQLDTAGELSRIKPQFNLIFDNEIL